MNPALRSVLWTVLVAFGLWFLTFAVPWGNYWLKLCLSASVLAVLGLKLSGKERTSLFPFKGRHLWVGLFSALLLYGVFWAGRQLSFWMFPFASREVSNIYANKAQLDPLAIGLLLFFVMGPSEEIYWHGYVQRTLSRYLGSTRGLLLTTAIYALVHISAWNGMLLLAAAVCGLFWGWLYQREQSLIPVMISHSVWDVLIFILFPMS